jgi:hypothetical protein
VYTWQVYMLNTGCGGPYTLKSLADGEDALWFRPGGRVRTVAHG